MNWVPVSNTVITNYWSTIKGRWKRPVKPFQYWRMGKDSACEQKTRKDPVKKLGNS
jgi:hypothetical protein